jgi:hypothetical protein
MRLADNSFIPPDPANLDWVAYQKWLGAGNAPDPAPTPPPSPIISRAAFWNLFTPSEQAAIVGGAQSDVTLGVWLQTAQTYDQIDLSSPLTKAGLDALVAAGVLTSDRETEILTPT